MSYTEKLIAFMEGKKAEIIKVAGAEYGELYFTEEDAMALLSLSGRKAKEIYTYIQVKIAEGYIGLNQLLCPFCYIVDCGCSECSYGKTHGKCATEGSEYLRLFDICATKNPEYQEKLDRLNRAFTESYNLRALTNSQYRQHLAEKKLKEELVCKIFSSEFYKNLIEEIER